MSPCWSPSAVAAACRALRQASRRACFADRLAAAAGALEPALAGGALHAFAFERAPGGKVSVIPATMWSSDRALRRPQLARWAAQRSRALREARARCGELLRLESARGVGLGGADEMLLHVSPLGARRSLALIAAWGRADDGSNEAAAALLQTVAPALAVALRAALLAEALGPWCAARARLAPREAGSLLLSPSGERLGSTRGAEALLAAIGLPAIRLADVLVTLADVVGRGPGEPGGLEEVFRALPLRSRGHVEAIFRRLEGPPTQVLVLLRRREEGLTAIDSERLDERESMLALRAARGLTNREIGAEVGLSADAVKRQLGRIYRKLAVSGRLELGRALVGHA